MAEKDTVMAGRYVAAVGVVIVLYDHLLTLKDEVEHIWNVRWTAPKLLFLLLRYIVPGSIVWHTYQLSGINDTALSANFCKRWFITAVCICFLTTGPMHFFVMLRLWILSQRNRHLVFGTLGLFFLTEFAIMACSIAVIVQLTPTITFDRAYRLCTLEKRSFFWSIFAPGMAFETVALLAVCCNALRGPRVHSLTLRSIFRMHGVGHILLVFFLNAVILAGAISIPMNVVFFYISFLWCTTTLATMKLVIKLRKRGAYERQEGVFQLVDNETQPRNRSTS